MRPRTFVIKGTVYPFDTIVSVGGSIESAIRELLELGVAEEAVLDVCKQGVQGRTLHCENGVTLIRLKHLPNEPVGLGYLVHELCHAVQFLFQTIGIGCSEDSYEAHAYYIGYLTKTILENLKQKIELTKIT